MNNYQDPAFRGGQQSVNQNDSQQQYQQAPYQHQQQGYQQATQQNYQQQNFQNEQPVKVGEWILTMILAGIPFVGFILMLVWAFGSDTKKSKSNWAKAQLLVMVIAGVLITAVYLVVFLVFGVASFGQGFQI